MKSVLPFFAFILLFASCTTAYKTGQTPDDVYYSPARPQDEYVRTENRQDRYQYNEQSEDDRYLRMKVRNRRTWSDLDYYYSDPYAYNYNYHNRLNVYGSLYYNTPWNTYSSWNYYYNPYNRYNSYYGYNNYYNPYGSKVVVVNQRPSVYNRPRTFNLNTYNPQPNDDSKSPRRTYRGDTRSFDYNTNNGNNNSSNNNSGSRLRNVFGTDNSSSNNSSTRQNTTPTRSEPSSSRPAPSSSSGSTNAPVRKF